MLAKYPASLLELFKIQGLGPKSIRLLYDTYNVQTIDDLERVCKEQKLRELPRMGAKLEEKVLRSIASYRQTQGRFLLSFAERAAEELIEYLSRVPGVEKVTPAGSLRRAKETVGDLDLLVTGPGAAAALEKFVAHPRVHEVLGKGPNKASIKYGLEGLQVDLRALPNESYGAALQYFTGSKDHNVALRSRAQKMGLTLNEYGLARLDGGDAWRAQPKKKFTELWGWTGFLRNCARTPARLTRRPSIVAEAGRAERHARRSAHAYDGERRACDACGNGGGGARARARLHRDHGPLEGAGDGEWAG